MTTFTTGPAVTDRATTSLVVQIENNTDVAVPVVINVYNLGTCPKTLFYTATLNVGSNDSQFTIFSRPPTRFEVEIEGMVDNMFAWIGGRNVVQAAPINQGSYLASNIFNNSQLVEVEAPPSPGIFTLTTGPVVVSNVAASTLVEVLNNTDSVQSVTVNIYNLSTNPKTIQYTDTLNLTPICSLNRIFPTPPSRYEVEFVNLASFNSKKRC